jgi:hypothetical protein
MRKQAKGRDETWKQQAESWAKDMKEAEQQEWEEYVQRRRKYGKPRLKGPRRLVIDALANRPADDKVVDKWKIMKIEVTTRYTLADVYYKVRMRWCGRWKFEWQEEDMESRRAWGAEEEADWSEIKSWIEGTSYVIYAKMKEDEDISGTLEQSKHWESVFQRAEWRKRLSRRKWQKRNPGWEDSWEEPEGWNPGEREWIEGQDSYRERIRRAQKIGRQEWQNMLESKSEEERQQHKEMRARLQKAISEEEAEERESIAIRRESEERWKIYQEERTREEVKRLKGLVHEEEQENQGGSQGHSLLHPNEVAVAGIGCQGTYVHTSKEGKGEDDPSTKEREIGSEGHTLTHPNKVAVTVAGRQRTYVHTLEEGVREDHPSVSESASTSSSTESSASSSSSSSMSSEESEENILGPEEEDVPPPIRIKDEQGEP